MNATPLYQADGVEAGVWRCGTCARLFAEKGSSLELARGAAEKCCAPRRSISKYQRSRWPREQEARERERQRFTESRQLTLEEARAPETAYTDPVFAGGRFFANLEELLDRFDAEELPDYVWCAEPVAFRPNVRAMIQTALEDHHEGADVSAAALQELTDLVAAWADQQGVVSWEESYQCCIVLRPAPAG